MYKRSMIESVFYNVGSIDLNWDIFLTKMNKYKNNEDIINRLKDFYFNSNVDIKYLEDIGVSKKLIKFI